MRREPVLLDKIRKTKPEEWIRSIGATTPATFNKAADEFLYPGRMHVRRMTDEDLATLIGEEPATKLGQLAASEMRRRESWRGPDRWLLLVAAVSLAASLVAIVRTL